MKFGSEIDFGDIFASGLLGLVLNVLVFMTALWMGFMISEAAIEVGRVAAGRSLDLDWLKGPFSHSRSAAFFWMLFGVIGLGASYFKFSRLDSNGAIFWNLIIGAVSALQLGLWLDRRDIDLLPMSAIWLTWAILLGMLGTALWFMRQWQMNRWATELVTLEAENAARRAEMEEEEQAGE